MTDKLLDAIDRLPAVKVEPTRLPHNPPLEFRHRGVAVLNEIARLQFEADGGDLSELDSLDVQDDEFVVAVDDLNTLVGDFYRSGDQPRYSALRELAEWAGPDA